MVSGEESDLIEKMMEYDSETRITIQEIKNHPWFLGEMPKMKEIDGEMSSRVQKVDKILWKEIQLRRRRSMDNEDECFLPDGSSNSSQSKDEEEEVPEAALGDLLTQSNEKLAEILKKLELRTKPNPVQAKSPKRMQKQKQEEHKQESEDKGNTSSSSSSGSLNEEIKSKKRKKAINRKKNPFGRDKMYSGLSQEEKKETEIAGDSIEETMESQESETGEKNEGTQDALNDCAVSKLK